MITLAADSALSGEFMVTYPGIGSTAPIAYDASDEVFAASLRAVGSDIGETLTVSRQRTGVRGYSWTVTFDDLSTGDRPQLTAANVSLQTRDYGQLAIEVETLANGSDAIGGTFELAFPSPLEGYGAEAEFTGPLNHDVSARELEIALEALPGIDDVTVGVELLDGGDSGRIFTVVWPAGTGNVRGLYANGTGLTPAASMVYVNEV